MEIKKNKNKKKSKFVNSEDEDYANNKIPGGHIGGVVGPPGNPPSKSQTEEEVRNNPVETNIQKKENSLIKPKNKPAILRPNNLPPLDAAFRDALKGA